MVEVNRRTAVTASGSLVAALIVGSRVSAEEELNPPSVFVWIEVEAASGFEDETRNIFFETIKSSHKPGILSAKIFEDIERRGVFHSLQEWESEEAFQQHMKDASSQEGGLEHATRTLKGPPKLSILTQLG